MIFQFNNCYMGKMKKERKEEDGCRQSYRKTSNKSHSSACHATDFAPFRGTLRDAPAWDDAPFFCHALNSL
jgi:hypothetical protein